MVGCMGIKSHNPALVTRNWFRTTMWFNPLKDQQDIIAVVGQTIVDQVADPGKIDKQPCHRGWPYAASRRVWMFQQGQQKIAPTLDLLGEGSKSIHSVFVWFVGEKDSRFWLFIFFRFIKLYQMVILTQRCHSKSLRKTAPGICGHPIHVLWWHRWCSQKCLPCGRSTMARQHLRGIGGTDLCRHHKTIYQGRAGKGGALCDLRGFIFTGKPPNTLPKTNIAPTNGWLEYYFPIGEAYFQGLR